MGTQGSKLALFTLSLFHTYAGACLSEVRILSVNIYSPTKVHTYTHLDDVLMLWLCVITSPCAC